MTDQRQPGGFAVPESMYEDMLRALAQPLPFRTEHVPPPPLTRRQRIRAIPRRVRLALGERFMDLGARLAGYDTRGGEW